MIFLIGLSGVGKTYWGAKLASQHGIIHYDTDSLVEAATGMCVKKIFEASGEQAFRQYEKEELHKVINKQESCIVSCGGGLPVFADNMQVMLTAGCVVYLKASTTYIANQLKRTAPDRPLLQGGDLVDKLNQLLESRKNIYEQAHYTVDMERQGWANFTEIINRCIQTL